jgi:uncharacterized protein GlcG (DUF336 family)
MTASRKKLDCFAEPVIGRRFAPTRWLAMTSLANERVTMRTPAMIVAAVLALATPAIAGDDALVTYKSLSPEVALEAAQAALKKCRDNGFQIAVAVVDRFGQPQVMLRDRFAGLPAPDTAVAKAYTALSFRAATSELSKSIKSGQMDAGLARLPHVAMLAGGLMIETGGTLLGGIGVSGAPGGDKDEECAKAGLDAIRDKIDF